MSAPISYAQEDLWYVSRLVPDAVPYNEVGVLRRTGPLDVAAFRQAWDEVVARHESWRTTYPVVDGRPRRVVAPGGGAEITVVDVSDVAGDRERAAARAAADVGGAPYDLEHGPTLRPLLVRLADDDWRFYLAAHHLGFDCLSVARVAVPELLAAYDAALAGKPSVLPPVETQYDDYVAWERPWLEGARGQQRLEHWRQHLAGVSPSTLPPDRVQSAMPRFRGGAEPLWISAELTERLRAAGQAAGGSLFQALAAGFAALLHHHSAQPEVMFATAVDLRRRPEFERMLGFAASWLAIRADFTDDPTFSDVVRQLRDEVLQAVDMAVPFGQVVAALHPRRGRGGNPLLRTLFVVNPTAELPPGWDLDFTDALVADGVGSTKLDLQVELQEHPGGGIRGRVLFDIDVFDRETIRSLTTEWPALLEAIVADPAAPVPAVGAPSSLGRQPDVDGPRTEVETVLVAIWQRILEVERVGIHDDFFDLGGRSLLAVEMLLAVEQEIGAQVPVAALIDSGATVAGLARLIESGVAASPVGRGGVPVFFIWPHNPAVLALRHLYDAFEDPVLPLVVPDQRLDPASIDELADLLIAEIRGQRPVGPYVFAGFSLGALVGYEVAGRLVAAGEKVQWLGMIDAPTPQVATTSFGFSARLARWLDQSPEQRRRRLASRFRTSPAPGVSEAKHAAEMRAFEHRWLGASGNYVPRGHDVPTDLFVSHDSAWRYREPALGWDRVHAGPLSVHLVPGSHNSLLAPPHVGTLADLIRRARRSRCG
jgi:thioesterase domain-containing protein/acyl carrier protein